MSQDIEVKELKQRIAQGDKIHFFDVREEWEYEEFNIGANLLPLNSIPGRIDQIKHLQHEEIIVHCKTGGRSNQAKIFLESKGFTNVRSLLGGIEAYKAD